MQPDRDAHACWRIVAKRLIPLAQPPTITSAFISKERLLLSSSPLLAVLGGDRRDPPPIWIMRQAGRYLPEYRQTRERAGGFLNMVYAPEIAAEITLQPIRRFQMDGAILFSDILIVAHALGQALTFVEGEGPRLAPPLAAGEVDTLAPAYAHFDPIYATVARVPRRTRPGNRADRLRGRAVDGGDLYGRRRRLARGSA